IHFHGWSARRRAVSGMKHAGAVCGGWPFVTIRWQVAQFGGCSAGGVCMWSCDYRSSLGQGPFKLAEPVAGKAASATPGNPVATNPRYPVLLGDAARRSTGGARQGPRRDQRGARGFSLLACFTRIAMLRRYGARKRGCGASAPLRVATTTEATMTRNSGKTSPADDTVDTPIKAAKRVVSKAAEKAPAKAAVKVSKTAAKTATKTAAKKTAKSAAAADKPEKVKAARAKKAEDKLADLVGGGARPSSGRRPGRPAKNANNDNDTFDDPMDGEGEVLPDLKPPKRGGKRGKADPKDLIARGPVTPEEYEARRNRLKQLIKLGKDRGYLTYGEINDHLPDDLVDAEAIDGIISTFSDMGISVYDQAPDAETLLMSENAPVASNDDDVEDEAEAALTTVDSDFGRTTDPVRMYMREMGSVELLTREGEIEIAKRIEDGLKHMAMAISACPTTINEILAHITRVREGQAQIDEVVDGLVDPEDGEEYAGAGVAADDDENDDGPAGGMSSKQLEDLRVKALAKFDIVT